MASLRYRLGRGAFRRRWSALFVLEPGPIDVFVGAASDDIHATGRIAVTGDTFAPDSHCTYLSEALAR
ncbi:hypothetical protein [Streptomyces sp. NPDC097610]|uniref:hypothetical protein n=1 Tax=Streptomyces sp. NPDC097610 TaxID=3157227 RepID=UPI0033190D79